MTSPRSFAVVTGASSGIGLEPARQFATPGPNETESFERADMLDSAKAALYGKMPEPESGG